MRFFFSISFLFFVVSDVSLPDILTESFLADDSFASFRKTENSGMPEGWSVIPGQLSVVTGQWNQRPFSLSHRVRGFAPHRDEELDPDWVGSVQSRLHFEVGVPGQVQFSLRHSLWRHRYHRWGYFVDNHPRASRDFEQRVRVGVNIPIGERTHLFIPLTVKQAHHGEFIWGARYNNRWRYSAWLHPELTYHFDSGGYLSFEYESDTFVSSSGTEFYLAESLFGGITFWAVIPL